MKETFDIFISPENEAEKSMTLRDFYADVNREILRVVYEIFKVSEENLSPEIKKSWECYATFLTDSIIESDEVSTYFKNIVPSALHKPEAEQIAKKRASNVVAFEINKTELAEKLKTSEFNGQNEDFKSRIYEKMDRGVRTQESYNCYVRNDGRIVIEELLKNHLTSDANLCESHLVITDTQAECKLDINQMIPEKYRLCPRELTSFELKFNEEGEIYSKVHQVDLKNYEGTNKSGSEFICFPNAALITYGNLSEKAGLMSLFHEIAHSWNRAYKREKYEQRDFDEFYLNAIGLFEMIEERMEKKKNGEIAKDEFDTELNVINQAFKESGIYYDIKNFEYSGEGAKEGDIIFINPRKNGKKYLAKCDILKNILTDYEKSERNAWAHALLMLRLLRKKGIDLEPDLTTLEDYNKVIETNLKSYQNGVEEQIQIVGEKIKFMKKRSTSS